MREKHTVQRSIFEQYAEHEIGQELKSISQWLDQNTEVLDWVAADISPRDVADTGRPGLSVESVLRCALLKQYRQMTYVELAFCLLDSTVCQTFARLPRAWWPRKSVLHRCIGAISAATWEQINQRLVHSAQQARVEQGKMLRIDSTVIAAPIHAPSDSTLLWDSVRVLVRLLRQAEELAQGLRPIEYRNHRRLAKRRMRAIRYTRGADKKAALYRDLMTATRNSLSYVEHASRRLLALEPFQPMGCEQWQAQWQHYRPLILKIIDQTERRVLAGEKVPASDKIVSLFEEHSDIIVKGGREVQYGHKLNLSTGRSGLILDVVIEAGNPADAERLLPMLDRHIEHYGKPPRQMAADGAYASVENLHAAKARQVTDVVFHKKRGLKVEDMAKSPWVYRKLRNFRAGIEAGISCLKRAYGLGCCTWKGLARFKAYVWSSVVAHNLALFSRLIST
jgi:transposase, IS5 family